ERDDARVPALAHDAVEDIDLVAEHLCRLRIETELQGYRPGVAAVGVLRLPDLAEAAHTQQLDQLQINVRERPLPGPETRLARRQQREQVARLAQHQPRGHPPGRPGGPPAALRAGAWRGP